jgi:hypothetical protein
LVHTFGVEDSIAKTCVMLNRIANAEMEKFKKDESADKATFEQNKQVFSMTLRGKIRYMQVVKQIIEELESSEKEAYLGTLVMPPAECLDKIHRADAALERRFFKDIRPSVGDSGCGTARMSWIFERALPHYALVRVFAGNLPYKRAGLRHYVSRSGSSIGSCHRFPNDGQRFRNPIQY